VNFDYAFDTPEYDIQTDGRTDRQRACDNTRRRYAGRRTCVASRGENDINALIASTKSTDWPLKELHWLSVGYRIQFKLALVMFTIHTRRCPDYLGDSVQACNSDPARTLLGIQQRLHCTTDKNETWRQSLLCGRSSCMEQSTSSSS